MPKEPIDLSAATIIPAKQCGIKPALISPNALKVMQKLDQSGFDAFLVGGAVRDMALKLTPKDFDVATNATPEQCRKLFKNARIIGRRFQIVHVRYGREIIEVTTFRGNHEAGIASPKKNKTSAANEDGMLLRDNVFGSVEEDAIRRDFTTNALYYSDKTQSVYDFCGGLDDIAQQRLRLIGEPTKRYQEDPVRMLRAIRFSAKLGFAMEDETAVPITELANLLENINAARLFDESCKLLLSGQALKTIELLEQYQLLPYLLNDSKHLLSSDFNRTLFNHSLENTDKRIGQGKSINPAFLWAVFLWPAMQSLKQTYEHDAYPPMAALHEAANRVLSAQVKLVGIPKRLQVIIKEIWEMQLRLPNTQGKKPLKLLQHPRFRAAYDFLLLREQAGEETGDLGKFWTQFQDENPNPTIDYSASKTENLRPRRRRSSNNKANS